MIILNKSKSVKVLKAIGLPPLRLFPGHNTIDEKNIGKYFDGNAAAEGVKKECLEPVDSGGITYEEKAEADKAKKKNDELNRAQKIIKSTNEKLVKSDDTISSQKDTIAKQGKQLAEQSGTIEDLTEKVGQMMSKIEELSKPKKKK